MDTTLVAAALLSAFLHAGWNAAVKSSRDPTAVMTAQMVFGGVISLPLLFWFGLPDRAAWPWIAASTLCNVATLAAMLRAYALGGFGVVYPIMRAVSVLLVVPLAALLAGDQLGLAALVGIGIITLALGALAVDAGRDQSLSATALCWTLLAGLGTAAYILCDAQGVRAAGSPLAYGLTVAVTNAAAMLLRQRDAKPWAMSSHVWTLAIPLAAASMTSYLLIIWVWSQAAIAPAAALRDTSAIFAVLIAVFILKEPFTRTRILAVLLAAAAIPLLRLG
jgi:drug/metabolite transporter (DMT)-like permease